MRGELRASASERGGVDEPESVIVCVEGIPEGTTLSAFAPEMIFIQSKNWDKRQIYAPWLVNGPVLGSLLTIT